jgi:hypothetical protein
MQDPMKIGLIYVKHGSFVLKLRPKTPQVSVSSSHREGWHDPQQTKEYIVYAGQYLDDDRILKDYGMILVGLTCFSSTGNLLTLRESLHKYLIGQTHALSKHTLQTSVLSISRPMPDLSSKKISAFLSLFDLEVY